MNMARASHAALASVQAQLDHCHPLKRIRLRAAPAFLTSKQLAQYSLRRSAPASWLCRMIVTDVTWLLKQSYHRFWSQVIFDESFHTFIDSYLSYAPRAHNDTARAEVSSQTSSPCPWSAAPFQ